MSENEELTVAQEPRPVAKAILFRVFNRGRRSWAIISGTNSVYAPSYWSREETIAKFRLLEKDIAIHPRKGLRSLAEVEAWQKDMQKTMRKDPTEIK